MPGLDFNALLQAEGVDPRGVVVLRHRPYEPELRKVFPWLIAERRELFDAYQRTHGKPVESSVARATHVASFFGHEAGRALFVGLYRVAGSTRISRDDYWGMPEHQTLADFGMIGLTKREGCLLFDLKPLVAMAEWSGRLVCRWPGLERAWRRWAGKNVFPVHAIAEESLLVASMPAWQNLLLDWRQLQVMPASWKAALRQWRGVYYIRDRASGKGYVGSAYGLDNLLGRWLNYASSGHGGNKLLRGIDPAGFEFSILQLVAPDMPMDDVIALERSWKLRLHTLEPDGLNRN
ncbi:hypothetical protein GCM10027084_15460 [Pseudoxanthomonas sangjuensis]|uniref:GIY-YIG nuclease family protein n=1 Tax=Pseudoxanthomonas sangjuensis TaxID=1503750 RepID=UPI001391DC76|nr:GIY-YIG nuclease family protein [Pseudoxanthomonas sangjuensis]KAF1715835.1 hypothetical protein CSC71_00915 [Pseudoxanthomonas sangjuensis]